MYTPFSSTLVGLDGMSIPYEPSFTDRESNEHTYWRGHRDTQEKHFLVSSYGTTVPAQEQLATKILLQAALNVSMIPQVVVW